MAAQILAGGGVGETDERDESAETSPELPPATRCKI